MNQPGVNPNLAHPLLHVRHADDVLVILEAVRLGIFPLMTQRLSASERDALRSGSFFVWKEDQREGGLVRWTDGRKWSQSKVSGECLLYQEKVEVTDEEREAKAKRRVVRIFNPGATVSPPPRNLRPSKSDGLTKQTYSFLVRLPGSPPQKWHMVAYSVWSERGNLPVIGDYPILRNIRIPEGVFARSKASDSVSTPVSTHREGRYESGPLPNTNNRGHRAVPRAIIMRQSATACADVDPIAGVELPLFNPGKDCRMQTALPPITCISSTFDQRMRIPTKMSTPSSIGDPVRPEDRRILNSFKLRL